MPESALWAIDDEGCVLCLSTWRSAWTRVVGRGSKIRHFKRVAASSWCLLALGCDHQVYLMVHGCDVKIRVPEMVCENERWSPLGGFHSNKLNLWDPPAFSDLSGKIRRCREDVVLPSTRWVWEDDWRIQETIQGEVTETGGWQYAVNFSSVFGSERRLGTFVRRRRWIRYRQYIALDRWVLIPVSQDFGKYIHAIDQQNLTVKTSQISDGALITFVPMDPFLNETEFTHYSTEKASGDSVASQMREEAKQRGSGLTDLEPVVDIAVGGESLPHQEDGFLSVWVVTLTGKLLYRTHVSRRSPEGIGWEHVSVPRDDFVLSVSIGPLGNIWICTDSNDIYVRLGVNWQRPFGTSWYKVEPPLSSSIHEGVVNESSHFQYGTRGAINQITIGVRSVWCVSTTGEFWFRRDVDCTSNEVDVEEGSFGAPCLAGRAWVSMLGHLRSISIGHNDQVWAIDFLNHGLLHRASVGLHSLSGKYWQPLHLVPMPGVDHGSRLNSSNSSTSLASGSSSIYEEWDRRRLRFKERDYQKNLRRLSTPIVMQNSCLSSSSPDNPRIIKQSAEIAQLDDDPFSNEFTDSPQNKELLFTSTIRNRSLSEHTDSSPTRRLTFTPSQTTFYFPYGGAISSPSNGEEDEEDAFTQNSSLSSSLPIHSNPSHPCQRIASSPIPLAMKTLIKIDRNDLRLGQSPGESFPQLIPLSASRRKLSSITNVPHSPSKMNVESNNNAETVLLRWVCASALFLDSGLPRVWLRSNMYGRHLPSEECQQLDTRGINYTPGVIPGHDYPGTWTEKENLIKGKSSTLLSYCPFPSNHTIEHGRWKESILSELQNRDNSEYKNPNFKDYPTAIQKESWRRDTVCQLLFGEVGNERSRWVDAKVTLEHWSDGLDIKAVLSVAYKGRKSLQESISIQLEEISMISKLNPIHGNMTNIASSTTNNTSVSTLNADTWSSMSDLPPHSDVIQVAMAVYILPCNSALLRIYQEWKNMNCFRKGETSQVNQACNNTDAVLTTETNQSDNELQKLNQGGLDKSTQNMTLQSKQFYDYPVMVLRMSTEQELDDWIVTLRQLAEHQRSIWLPRKLLSGGIWMLNELQEPFHAFSHVQRYDLRHPDAKFYNRIGGHFSLVTSGAAGLLTWALTHDGTAYVYYCGGEYGRNLSLVTDTRSLCTYEYQRWRLFTGFSDRKSFFNPYMWSDSLCREWRPKEAVRLLSHYWSWREDWTVDHSPPGGCDSEGWQYSKDFTLGRFVREPRWNMNVRRRKWIRKYHVSCLGPWREVTPSSQLLRDISILPWEDIVSSHSKGGVQEFDKSVDVKKSQSQESNQCDKTSDEEDYEGDPSIDLWAVTIQGELLRRRGIRLPHCKEGTHWVQLETETRFISISISPQRILWAVCESGSVWLRLGITAYSEGVSWTLVGPSPDGCPFKQISAGGCNNVWAVDERERLWCRTQINSLCLTGMDWQLVTNAGVSYVSCGPCNKVWATFSLSRCVAERIGISEKDPAGVSWIPALRGVVWLACVRGSYHDNWEPKPNLTELSP